MSFSIWNTSNKLFLDEPEFRNVASTTSEELRHNIRCPTGISQPSHIASESKKATCTLHGSNIAQSSVLISSTSKMSTRSLPVSVINAPVFVPKFTTARVPEVTAPLTTRDLFHVTRTTTNQSTSGARDAPTFDVFTTSQRTTSGHDTGSLEERRPTASRACDRANWEFPRPMVTSGTILVPVTSLTQTSPLLLDNHASDEAPRATPGDSENQRKKL
ncbi:hypothetical protein DPMN_137607 [Dreissena polymorpha]|uniref:Uncharacterized protein n=1 Tax=Dreissena polymorpha TaxID=45954 RepID=A0A9D4G5K7_DREPO|nr:hypothetical protein DPMN_137607 [Dreissena polymorpha]